LEVLCESYRFLLAQIAEKTVQISKFPLATTTIYTTPRHTTPHHHPPPPSILLPTSLRAFVDFFEVHINGKFNGK
jgi:hypothetical protein